MRTDPDLHIETDELAGCPVARLRGTCDFRTSPRLRKVLRRWVQEGARAGVVNLKDVEKMDTTGVATLVETARDMGEAGRIMLVSDSPSTRRVLELSGMEEFCECYDSEDEAAGILEKNDAREPNGDDGH